MFVCLFVFFLQILEYNWKPQKIFEGSPEYIESVEDLFVHKDQTA